MKKVLVFLVLVFLVLVAAVFPGCAKEEPAPAKVPETKKSEETKREQDSARVAKELQEERGEGEVMHLIGALRDKDWEARSSAVEALVKMGEQALEPLIRALRDKDEDARQSAASALAKIGKPAIDVLVEALKDRNRYVRENAAWALGEIGDKKAVEPLIRVLRDGHAGVRGSAAWALGKIGDKKAVAPLTWALADGNEDVRTIAEKALAKVKPPEPPKRAEKKEVISTPESTIRAYLKALGSMDAGKVFDYLEQEFKNILVKELAQLRRRPIPDKRKACALLGVSVEKLESMSAREYFIAGFGLMQSTLYEKGFFDVIGDMKIAGSKTRGNRASVRLVHPQTGQTESLELVKEDGHWKVRMKQGKGPSPFRPR